MGGALDLGEGLLAAVTTGTSGRIMVLLGQGMETGSPKHLPSWSSHFSGRDGRDWTDAHYTRKMKTAIQNE